LQQENALQRCSGFHEYILGRRDAGANCTEGQVEPKNYRRFAMAARLEEQKSASGLSFGRFGVGPQSPRLLEITLESFQYMPTARGNSGV
jgi:hypothetical protein